MDQGSGGSANSSDFVRKLYKMLENPTDESVVRWGNEGDSFVVLENEKFTKHILPKHFKHSNFASFVRQLNKYDFHKVRHSNEDGAGSPYGPGAWEFKHPDFKMNNKDALDNIRRKAPAARKPAPAAEELPTHQIDMLSGQLVATQHQVTLLESQNTTMSQEIAALKGYILNHEQVLSNVVQAIMSDYDVRKRRHSRILFPGSTGELGGHAGVATATDPSQPLDYDETPPSPLLQASKLLSETNMDVLMSNRHLETLHDPSLRNSALLASPNPELNGRASTASAPPSAGSSGTLRFTDLDNLVYPMGSTNGIDPMYGEHIHNIPYSMPVSKAMESQIGLPPTAAARRQALPDPGWLRQPQILLVEDDPTCRKIGNKFLGAFSCSVTTAHDGIQAVDKVKHGMHFDLILMDIIMPNLDGVSACHLIRQHVDIPTIAMTSNIRSDDIHLYYQHGMSDILPKPFTKEGLLQLLEKHLSHLKKHPLESHPLIKDEDPSTSSVYHHHLSALQSPSKPLTPSSATWTNASSPQAGAQSQRDPHHPDDQPYGMYAQPGTVVNPNGLAYVPAQSQQQPGLGGPVVGQRRPLDMGEDLGGGKRQQQMYPQQGMGMRTR